jgi:RND family efflux transporter MFP subunit
VGKMKNLLSKLKNLVWHHKILSIIIIVVLVIVGFVLFPKGSKLILTEIAKNQDVIKTISTTGKIVADNSVNLTFQFGGKLTYLGAKEGDTVKKWQAIASIDRNQLEASFRQAQQNFTAAKAASDQYYDNHRNNTESYDEKVRRTALDASQNIAYDQMMKAQQDLNNSTLYSPIDGILTSAPMDSVGVNITPATVFTVTDPTTLTFSMDIDETDIGNIRNNQALIATLDAFPDKQIELTVNSIDFVSHTTTSGGNAFTVKAKLTSDKGYRIGMNGNADIIVDKRINTLTVPSSSVIDDNYIYLKKNDKFIKQKVKLGLQSDTLAEVLSGASKGDIVAIDPGSVPQDKIAK